MSLAILIIQEARVLSSAQCTVTFPTTDFNYNFNPLKNGNATVIRYTTTKQLKLFELFLWDFFFLECLGKLSSND